MINFKYTPAIKIIFIIVAVAYIAQCYFNFPSADDYSYSNQAIQHGWWNAILNEYNHWGGRYTSAAILSTNPIVYGSYTGYQLCSAFNISIFFIALFIFLQQLFKTLKLSGNIPFIPFYLSFTLCFTTWIPGVNQGFYWLAGYVNYTLPMTALFILSTYFLKNPLSQAKPIVLLIAAFLLFIIVGFNETIMFQLNSVLWLYLIYYFYKDNKINIKVLTLAASCLAGGLLTLAAPGNYVRKSNFDPINPLYAAWKSLGSALEHIPQFISPSLIIGALLVIYYVRKKPHHFQHSIFHIKPMYTFLAYWMITSLGFLPAQISMGGNPDSRVDNVFYTVFFLSFCLWVVQFALSRPPKFTIYKTNALIVIFFMTLFIGNTGTGFLDLVFKNVQYRTQWLEIIALSKTSPGKDLRLPSIKNVPKTLHFKGIEENPNGWINSGFSKYYNLKSISAHSH